MMKITKDKFVTTKQLCDAVFNVPKYRNLTIAVFDHAVYDVAFPAKLVKAEERKRKRKLLNTLNGLTRAGCTCAVLLTVYDTEGEAMGLIALPETDVWGVLEPEQVEEIYTICRECGADIGTPSSFHYSAISKYL